MKTIEVKFHWDKPVCDDNKGHNCDEWGPKISE